MDSIGYKYKTASPPGSRHAGCPDGLAMSFLMFILIDSVRALLNDSIQFIPDYS